MNEEMLGSSLIPVLPSACLVGSGKAGIIVVTVVGRVGVEWEVLAILVGTEGTVVGGREPCPYLAWHSVSTVSG